MNIYSLLLFTSFLIYLYLGFQMLRVRPMPRPSRIFFVLCLAFAHWSFCITFLFSTPTKEGAFFWMDLSSLAWSFIPALLLHFSLVLSGWEQKIKKNLLPLLYLPGVLFVWREFTSNVIAVDFRLKSYGWTGINPIDSPWFIGFTSYYLIFVLTSAAVLYSWRRKTESPREKQQAKIIIFAVLCSVLLTFINETLLPAMDIHTIPKIPSLFTLIWALGMWYAITKYRLMDLSKAFTGEIILEELLEKLLQTTIENSGARRVVILLEEDGELLIQGEVTANPGIQKVLHNIPLEESSSLPFTLVRQVEASKERLIIDDLQKEEVFLDDPYLSQKRPSSLILQPLLYRGSLKGILYLENDQTPYVFTPERLEAIERIISQVVLSLENASLYANLQRSHDRLSEWNTMLEETIEERTMALRNLMDNAGQGFLSFGRNLLVHDQYSAECEKLLGDSIARERFSSLLFPQNKDEQEMFEEIFLQICREREEQRRDIYISLLPEEVELYDRNIHLEYRMIKSHPDREDQDVMMVILTDITKRRELEAMMEEEKNIFEMVVRVVSNFNDFNATLREFRQFCSTSLEEEYRGQDPTKVFSSIYRKIHTFKGSFHQFGMSTLAQHLHELETRLSQQREAVGSVSITMLKEIVNGEEMKDYLDESLLLLKTILGDTFYLQENALIIDTESLERIEDRIVELLEPAEIHLLLPELKRLRWKPFSEMLKGYPAYVNRLSNQMEKFIYPLEIEGGEMRVDLEVYRDFARSLGHVFRNAIEHGIESPEERALAGKKEYGHITCRLSSESDWIVVEIADDGQGISMERLEEKALEIEGLSPQSLSQEDLLHLIFLEGCSTEEEVSHLSGRGVGLSVVKREVERLGGKLEVKTQLNEGTTFTFYLPREIDEPMGKISYFELIRVFLKTARTILDKQCGILIEDPSRGNLSITNSLPLYARTTILPLRGVITGRLILTAERELCSYMLDHFALFEVEDSEREDCYDDLLAELLNTIIGNSLKTKFGQENLLITGQAEKLKSENALLTFDGKGMLTYRVALEQGSLSFTFLPGVRDFSTTSTLFEGEEDLDS